jgi:hypothetical protein
MIVYDVFLDISVIFWNGDYYNYNRNQSASHSVLVRSCSPQFEADGAIMPLWGQNHNYDMLL